MDCTLTNTLIVGFIPVAVIYLYYKFKKPSWDEEWRKKYFLNFDFNNQSKEIDSQQHTRINKFDTNTAKRIYEECNTPFKALILGMQRSKNGKCLGWREGSGYKWMNYSDTIEHVKYVGSALTQKIPLDKFKKNENDIVPVGFYMSNRPQCTMSQYGCVCYGYTIVPFYDSYGVDAIKDLINLAQISTVITDTEKRIGNFLRNYDPNKLSSIKLIIHICKIEDKELYELAKKYGIELLYFEDLIQLGKANPIQPQMSSHDKDVYAIVPTSGTTGEPKAAILTHKGVMFFAASYYATTAAYGAVFNENDIFFSYLPNAHVFDLSSMVSIMSRGVAIGYSRGDPKLLVEDMQTLRPTFVPMVARMLQKIHDKVMNGIREKGKLYEFLLRRAVAAKIKERERGIVRQDSIWDKLLFNKIRALTGGRIRIICCGAAPFPKDIMQFTRAAFSCYIFEGYGQTESTSATTVSHPVEPNYEHVGEPIMCLETKLIDVPDMEYYAKDNKGELCIRGPTIFSGYYRNEEKTKEAIDADGWLHTGDIGQWLPNGCLKIIDRKKQIFKLSHGEYIAPEKVENVIRRSQYIDQVYVDGNSLMHYIVAIIVPEPEATAKWGQSHGINGDFKQICKNKDFKEDILKDIVKVSRENKLNGLEIVKNISVLDEPFSVENGLLTPTQKNKRVALKKRFEPVINDMYKEKVVE